MKTIFSNRALALQSFGFGELKTASLSEPALLVGSAIFWIVLLPLVALFLMCVKVWDTLVALTSGAGVRPNPLILRRGLARTGLVARSSARTAQI